MSEVEHQLARRLGAAEQPLVRGLTAAELRNAIYTHPSSTEALNEVLDKVISS